MRCRKVQKEKLGAFAFIVSLKKNNNKIYLDIAYTSLIFTPIGLTKSRKTWFFFDLLYINKRIIFENFDQKSSITH